jgi:hypothetical protein
MRKKWIGAILTAGLLAGACTNNSSPGNGSSAEAASATSEKAEKIPQPTVGNFEVSPDSERVDLNMPTFSDPTNITNPLFPVSKQDSVLLLGRVEGKEFRTEVTLLPETRIIEWAGQRVEVLVSQYAAYLDGRIHEIAFDFYAQADDGSVWYFGEDVFNFADGAIADTHGTWIAGTDGPAAMIMPADPQVGDVYRPENIPGFVFEEVTVKSTNQTLPGPLGPVDGGLLIEELHMDGGTEDKSFAPAYGEFYTAGGGDVEALALAVPTDAVSGGTPEELQTLHANATRIFDAAATGAWAAAYDLGREMTSAWKSYSKGEVPKRIEPRMTADLRDLNEAIDARNSERTRQAAIDTAQWALDLQLRYRPPVEIDLARFDLWLAQLLVDSSAGNAAAVNGDFFSLDYIRDRILHALNGIEALRINSQLETLYEAVAEGDLEAAGDSAQKLRDTLAAVGN